MVCWTRLSHAAARHDGPAMDARDDLVFDSLTRRLATSATRRDAFHFRATRLGRRLLGSAVGCFRLTNSPCSRFERFCRAVALAKVETLRAGGSIFPLRKYQMFGFHGSQKGNHSYPSNKSVYRDCLERNSNCEATGSAGSFWIVPNGGGIYLLVLLQYERWSTNAAGRVPVLVGDWLVIDLLVVM